MVTNLEVDVVGFMLGGQRFSQNPQNLVVSK
jgi:hypothetical protein